MGEGVSLNFEPLGEGAQGSARGNGSAENDFESLVEASPYGVVVVDRDGNIRLVNEAAEIALGRPRERLLGHPFGYPVLGQERAHLDVPLPSGVTARLEMRVSQTQWGGELHYLVTLREQGRTAETWHGNDPPPRRDPLTGLLTRLYFDERIKQVLAYAREKQERAAIFVLDVDDFYLVNETLGHAEADRLLQVVAERMAANTKPTDVLGRLSGDEFILLTSDVGSQAQLAAFVNALKAPLETPVQIGGRDFHLSFTVGASVFPDHGADAEMLVRQAETALNAAKQSKNDFALYDVTMDDAATSRVNITNALYRALENEEFVLHYQPVVNLGSGGIVGAEALIRWNHPEEGLMAPDRFIPVAEATGLIGPIGDFVLKQTCRQIKAWQAADLLVVPIAINISAKQLDQADFADLFLDTISREGVEPGLVAAEVTETLLMESGGKAVNVLNTLKSGGVSIYLDDFGTGYSSLSHLKRLPVDRLKVDRSFINDLVTDPDDAEITVAIISMAHRLGLEVVAEGVETPAQLGFLRKRGCDLMQGYYFSRPIDEDAFAVLLSEGRCLAEATGDNPRSLLLLDDEMPVLNSLRRCLRMDGYRIHATTSPLEAFDILAQNDIGVVVSDVRMPEMDGGSFLARVRQLHPSTERMLLTGDTGADTAVKAINSGAAYKFLHKPWDSTDLRKVILDAFEHREAQLRSAENRSAMDEILTGTRLCWTPEFKVGVESLDAQHRGLFELHNALNDQVWSGTPIAAETVINQLREMMQAHFADEETLLKEIEYPDIAGHRYQHQRFFQKLNTLSNRRDVSGRTMAADVLAFFRTWILVHLVEEDMEYREFSQLMAREDSREESEET